MPTIEESDECLFSGFTVAFNLARYDWLADTISNESYNWSRRCKICNLRVLSLPTKPRLDHEEVSNSHQEQSSAQPAGRSRPCRLRSVSALPVTFPCSRGSSGLLLSGPACAILWAPEQRVTCYSFR